VAALAQRLRQTHLMGAPSDTARVQALWAGVRGPDLPAHDVLQSLLLPQADSDGRSAVQLLRAVHAPGAAATISGVDVGALTAAVVRSLHSLAASAPDVKVASAAEEALRDVCVLVLDAVGASATSADDRRVKCRLRGGWRLVGTTLRNAAPCAACL
jgi:hypothetical protein